MQERDDPKAKFSVKFDDLTLARLYELARCCDASPEKIISAIIHDVLEDDAAAHGETILVH